MPFFDGGHSGGSRSTTTVPVGISSQPFPSTAPAGNQLPAPFSGPLGQVGPGLPQSLGQPQSNWLSGVAGATSDPLKKQQQMGGMSAGV